MSTRFLIVDDSELVRQGLRALLQSDPDWEVCGEAPDGLTAVEMFRQQHPSVVIVDFQMPGINGIEAARRMLEIAPAVPILMFTQHASADLEKHALEVGIRSVIPKTKGYSMVGIIKALVGDEPTGLHE